MEYKVDIAGVSYGMNGVFSVSITRPLFEKFSVGNTCSATLEMRLIPKETVPRMAQIVPYARKTESDEWLKLGEFWTDTRAEDEGVITLTAYDAMLKAEQTFLADGDDLDGWPIAASALVPTIAERMGVSVDSRTVLKDYAVDYPNDLTMREILGYIAAAHGGNWIITAAGELLLVPLFASMPEETHYLVDEDGDAITFGGTRILV